MFRTLMLCLALAAPALAQRGEEYPADLPPVTTRQPTLPVPRITSLAAEPRFFGPRVDAGLINPRPPEEAEVDMEAVLRAYLPDEITLERNRERLRPTIERMQGVWRVEAMTLDGADLPPQAFAGLKYFIQGRVIAQSETSEAWQRVWPTPAGWQRVSRWELVRRGDTTQWVLVDRWEWVTPLGPAGVDRPAGAVRREDPRQEEAPRMNMLSLGDGQARVFWWNRYGESADPHLSRDRPSLRVALPVRGNLTVGENTLTLEVRGQGLRSLLPSKFHRPFNPLAPAGREEETILEGERRVALHLIREAVPAAAADSTESVRATRPNIIPELHRVRLGPTD